MRNKIIGNWKMNGTSADMDEIGRIADKIEQSKDVDSGLCIPATLISRVAAAHSALPVGGQDCHESQGGAHTGCISASMLIDAGAVMTIVGHSERRADQGESDADICGKAQAAIAAGLEAIVCVGETEAERDAGDAEKVVIGQLDGSVPDIIDPAKLSVAYEPVWAIGTGRIPSIEDVAAMHNAIRARLTERFGASGESIALLYGGSMNGGNAAELLSVANVNGGLVGGASLTAEKFAPILEAAAKA